MVISTTVHSWPQCPEGDIRPEAILSRAFGSSGTTRHHQVTLYKGPEWLHKPMYDFETPLRFYLSGHFLAVQIFLFSCYLGGKISDGWYDQYSINIKITYESQMNHSFCLKYFLHHKIFLRNLGKYLIIYPLDKNPWFGTHKHTIFVLFHISDVGSCSCLICRYWKYLNISKI